MNETDRWLAEYDGLHQELGNPLVHWLSVPILVVGIVGLLWALPVPLEFVEISPLLNWGSCFLLAAVVYYFVISLSLAIGMLPFVAAVMAFLVWLDYSAYSLPVAATGLTLAGIVGLSAGHFGHGTLRAVLRDLQLMMIAPLWLLSRLYRRVGMPF
ncbi:MAG: DUF962 domain-containing protein [Gammaproteobacteria bacterium]|nr:DUF962 domain-containing protein [Gammaproteobacteria bacterium]MDH4253760.1 DUF962 domain-containing protein [Gammaproteobacteria bacterium]MDH5309689.1 DUF962 domain-containing protein [Gammaproteobacteria bacterium]